jgi:DNA-binding GntR family transcriptional regulator
MDFEKSLPKMIASQIVSDIIDNTLHPGEKVVEERYSEKFGTSRGPVREALYLLENEGMVQRIPKRGAFVKKYELNEFCDLFEVRILLEIKAMDQLTFPLGEENVREIDSIIEKMEHAKKEDYPYLNSDFHSKLLSLSGSEVLINLYSRLGTPLMALQKLALIEPESIQQSLEEHKMLWTVIKNGKIKLAKVLLEDHNDEGIKRLTWAFEKIRCEAPKI